MDFGRDEFLENYMRRADKWVSEGKIPSASKVIPIGESLDALQWVLPTNQVVEVIRNARSFALRDCYCRSTYKRCDKPLEVCLLINDHADASVKKGRAKYVGLEEAVSRLKLANESGLVHLTLYNPEQHIFALCSCCECCCHDLQIMRKYQRPDFIAHSDYIAEVDPEKCIQCGKCTKRCVFGAQVKSPIGEGRIEYHPEFCYGCGLCLTTCSTQAITLKLRQQPVNRMVENSSGVFLDTQM